jgi:hypothetical protein
MLPSTLDNSDGGTCSKYFIECKSFPISHLCGSFVCLDALLLQPIPQGIKDSRAGWHHDDPGAMLFLVAAQIKK